MHLIVRPNEICIVAIMLFMLNALVTSVVFAYDLRNDGWHYQFRKNDFGKGLNSRFSLSIGSKYSYAEFIASSYYEWDEDYSVLSWPPIRDGEHLRQTPKKYISKIEFFSPVSRLNISLHSRVTYMWYVLPHIPNQIQSRFTSNENKSAESEIFFLPKNYLHVSNILEFEKPIAINDKEQLKFIAKLSEFGRRNYFGTTFALSCQPSLEKGAVKRLLVSLKSHMQYAPKDDIELLQLESETPTFLMKIFVKVNLDRILKSPNEEDKVTLEATCYTSKGYEFRKQQEVIIKSMYNKNEPSESYNSYSHTRPH